MPRLPAPAAAALLLAPVAAAAGTPRFVLPAATEHTPTPWDAESNPPLTPALAARGAVPWSWEPLPDPTAVCLDGSQYGLVICGGAGPYETVTINLQGGGVSAGGDDSQARPLLTGPSTPASPTPPRPLPPPASSVRSGATTRQTASAARRRRSARPKRGPSWQPNWRVRRKRASST